MPADDAELRTPEAARRSVQESRTTGIQRAFPSMWRCGHPSMNSALPTLPSSRGLGAICRSAENHFEIYWHACGERNLGNRRAGIALFLSDIFPAGYIAAETAQIESGDTVGWPSWPVRLDRLS